MAKTLRDSSLRYATFRMTWYDSVAKMKCDIVEVITKKLPNTHSTLDTDLQSVSDIEAICNRLANYKFAKYSLRIANPQRAWW